MARWRAGLRAVCRRRHPRITWNAHCLEHSAWKQCAGFFGKPTTPWQRAEFSSPAGPREEHDSRGFLIVVPRATASVVCGIACGEPTHLPAGQWRGNRAPGHFHPLWSGARGSAGIDGLPAEPLSQGNSLNRRHRMRATICEVHSRVPAPLLFRLRRASDPLTPNLTWLLIGALFAYCVGQCH